MNTVEKSFPELNKTKMEEILFVDQSRQNNDN